MAIGLFSAGQRITAALLNSVAPQSVIKPSDQSVTSSTVLVNDSALVVPVLASARYLFACYLAYEGGTRGSSDIKFAFTFPAAATLVYTVVGTNTSGTLIQSTTAVNATGVLGTNGATNYLGMVMEGSLFMSSTPGGLQLQWAQNTSSATATIVHAQSYLALWRVT